MPRSLPPASAALPRGHWPPDVTWGGRGEAGRQVGARARPPTRADWQAPAAAGRGADGRAAEALATVLPGRGSGRCNGTAGPTPPRPRAELGRHRRPPDGPRTLGGGRPRAPAPACFVPWGRWSRWRGSCLCRQLPLLRCAALGLRQNKTPAVSEETKLLHSSCFLFHPPPPLIGSLPGPLPG